nr:hypothetical protein BaRGS_031345 [Batillaria attramentaria]
MPLALQEASKLEREYGTQSAFGMSSRWLLIPTGGDNLLDHLHVSNVTMDNVALLDLSGETGAANESAHGFDSIWYDLVEPDDVLWGTGTAKDSDVGFFGHVIRKEADLGLAPCDVVHERTLLMDFASPP